MPDRAHLHPIDPRLIADYVFSEFPVLFQQGAHGAMNGRLHKAAHLEQLLVQLVKFNTEMPQNNPLSPDLCKEL